MHDTIFKFKLCCKIRTEFDQQFILVPQFGRGVIKFPAQAEIRDKRHGHLSNLNNAGSYNLRFRDKGKIEMWQTFILDNLAI